VRLVRRVDLALCGLLIAGGVGQWLLTAKWWRSFEEPAAWWFNGGTTLILLGGLGLARIRYGQTAPGVRWLSVAGNLMLSAFYLAMTAALPEKFARYPWSYAGVAILLAATAVSFRPGNPR
jgi:hypothetical protein